MCEFQECVKCGESKHWRRFRIRLGAGMFEASDTCSSCRARQQRADSSKAHYMSRKAKAEAVLNRTPYEIKPKMDYLLNRHEGEKYGEYKTRKELGYNFYYPKLEKSMRSYCNKKTAMDHKYLRDNQHLPLSIYPHLAESQVKAREHAQGWITFYDDIYNHAINLLRQTGTRPPWAQMEGSGTLQLACGVYHTRRAALLRQKG